MRTDGRTNGRTDRHDEANSRFSQFCERAYEERLCCHMEYTSLSCTLKYGDVYQRTDI
jgi:hypothetical protein